MRNKLVLNYGNNYGDTYTYEDATSQDEFGLYATNVQWNVFGAADAADLAERYISLRSTPYQRFQSISFDLGNPEIDNTDRDALLNIFMGLPVEIDGLPNNIATNGIFQGYVEGWSFRASYNGLQLTFNASPVAFNQVAVKWEQVAPTEYWNTLSSTLTWLDAIGVVS